MKNSTAQANQSTRRIRLIACSTALAAAFTISRPLPAHADRVTPPPVPSPIAVQAGNKAFLVGHAVGTQNYICLPTSSGFAFSLFTPEATLFEDNERQVITHFFSPNLSPIPPEVLGTIRATWQHSRDSSIVWGGQAISSSDSAFVAQGAIPWLLLPAAGVQEGPTGGRTLSATTFIQRLNTSGGVAPSTGCSQPSDVGAKAFVPYTADYFFYSRDPGNDDHN
jgi:hypothetical protein